MTLISKPLFYDKIGPDLQCKHLHFWDESCLKGNLSFALVVFLGSLKFFGPIYIVKAVINRRKFKQKTFWKELLLDEVRSGFYGVLMGILFLGSNCILCKMGGRLNYYNVGLISGLFSGLAVLIESKENHMLDTLIFSNLLMEALLSNMHSLNIFKLTAKRETLLFMGVSSMLMYMLQHREKNMRFTTFWFYWPPRIQNNAESLEEMPGHKCYHNESCPTFAFQGIQKFFFLGYIFSIVRKVIPKMLIILRKPSELLPVLVNIDNVRFATFIGGYVGIYRYVMCQLLKNKGIDQKYFGAIAGFISGATYSISPNLQLLTVGMATILQIFYNDFLKKVNIKGQLIPQQLVYMICHGLLMHNAIMYKDTCPKYYINMLDTCTNGMFWAICDDIIRNNIFQAV